MTYTFISESMKIGKHEWRICVFNHETYGPCTDYHWRRLPENICGLTYFDDTWRNMEDWPTYNSNNGESSGCPKTLKTLYAHNKPTVDKLLSA